MGCIVGKRLIYSAATRPRCPADTVERLPLMSNDAS